MPVDTITRKDIAARLVAITRESGSITAARARAAVNGFFVWALQMGYVEANPVIGSVQPKDSEGRSRVLVETDKGRPDDSARSGAPAATTITAAACGS